MIRGRMRIQGITVLALLTLGFFAGCDDGGSGPIAATGGATASGGSSSNSCVPACTNGFVCDGTTNTCVECTQSTHCTGGEICDTATKKCVAGTASGGAGGEGGEGGGLGGSPEGGDSGMDATGGSSSGCHPKVSLLIQRSGAMFHFPSAEDNWWDALASAFDSDEADLLDQYASRMDLSVRTFFMTAQGEQCLKGDVEESPVKKGGLKKFFSDQKKAHEELLEAQAKVDAPLVEAMDAAAGALGSGDASERRYVILALSGNPDACDETDTECVTDDAIRKVQELREDGLRVRVLYLKGEGNEGYPQALANAGRGYGIPNYLNGACGSELQFTENPMLADYGKPNGAGEVQAALDSLLADIAVCD